MPFPEIWLKACIYLPVSAIRHFYDKFNLPDNIGSEFPVLPDFPAVDYGGNQHGCYQQIKGCLRCHKVGDRSCCKRRQYGGTAYNGFVTRSVAGAFIRIGKGVIGHYKAEQSGEYTEE